MYGLLNAALKEFVVESYGAEVWQRIASDTAPGIGEFNKLAPYPDALTYSMVGRTCEEMGSSFETLMFAFGEFWVRYTDSQGYGSLFEIAGDSLREFVMALDALHARVAKGFPKLQPPSLRCEPVGERDLRMHYVTSRTGLCPMIPGILSGLSKRFKTRLDVTHPVCARQGAPHCEFLLVFPEHRA
jgi:predicted hydrocarbon binding protein